MAAAAAGHGQPVPIGIARDPEVLVLGVGVQAQPRGDDRGAGQGREGVGQKPAEPRLSARRHGPRRVGVDRPAQRVRGDLDHSVRVDRKPVVAGARHVGGEGRKPIRPERGGVGRPQMEHRMAAGPDRARQGRVQRSDPRAGGHDHAGGAERAAPVGAHAAHAARLLDQRRRAGARGDLDPGGLRLPRQRGHHRAALRVAAHAVVEAVHEAAGAPGGVAPRDRLGVQPFGAVAASEQRPVAVVLEAARRHAVAGYHQHPGLVVERPGAVGRPALVPAQPAGAGRLHERHVAAVGAVLHAHDLADVGAGGQRRRDRAGVQQRHRVAAGAQLQRRRDAEDAGADDDEPIGHSMAACHAHVKTVAIRRSVPPR